MSESPEFSYTLSEQEWKKKLTTEQYNILRQKATERPCTGQFNLHKEKGTYTCAGCGESLFTDEMKFDSGCGWPSFDKEIAGGKIKQVLDKSHGMVRTEIVCANCGGHLGHIFNDGPTQTGMRYCVNSLSLDFQSKNNQNKMEQITLGGGCFWCIEAAFSSLIGVSNAESGYAGGHKLNPTYKEVCQGDTGHAEVVKITFDPKIISLEKILEVFFLMHDPTTLNRQGGDIGTQYRSAIFYHTDEQKTIISNIINLLESKNVYDNKIVTKVEKINNYYPAEDYHQEYYFANKEQPYCNAVITPKMSKLKKVFSEILK
jgi:peptide methionine sulfoxide reductase msrA/msrB